MTELQQYSKEVTDEEWLYIVNRFFMVHGVVTLT